MLALLIAGTGTGTVAGAGTEAGAGAGAGADAGTGADAAALAINAEAVLMAPRRNDSGIVDKLPNAAPSPPPPPAPALSPVPALQQHRAASPALAAKSSERGADPVRSLEDTPNSLELGKQLGDWSDRSVAVAEAVAVAVVVVAAGAPTKQDSTAKSRVA